jgi:hypothetical protein
MFEAVSLPYQGSFKHSALNLAQTQLVVVVKVNFVKSVNELKIL